jgi:hypothetical protein
VQFRAAARDACTTPRRATDTDVKADVIAVALHVTIEGI